MGPSINRLSWTDCAVDRCVLCWPEEVFASIAHVLAISKFEELSDLRICNRGVFPEVVGVCSVDVGVVEPFVYVCEVFGGVFLLNEFFCL